MKRNIKDYLIILASLLDDVIIIGIVLLLLWVFRVAISLPLIIFIGILFVALIFITHRCLVPAYRRRKVTGAEGLVGSKGTVVESLTPEGVVKIAGEYWRAKAADASIESGETVEVIKVDGLKVTVVPAER